MWLPAQSFCPETLATELLFLVSNMIAYEGLDLIAPTQKRVATSTKVVSSRSSGIDTEPRSTHFGHVSIMATAIA